jgi:hypothetical protein
MMQCDAFSKLQFLGNTHVPRGKTGTPATGKSTKSSGSGTSRLTEWYGKPNQQPRRKGLNLTHNSRPDYNNQELGTTRARKAHKGKMIRYESL